MKKLKFLVVILIGLIIVTGCNKKSKTALSSDDFLKICNEKNIKMYDAIGLYAFADKAYVTSEEKYEILYIIGKNQSDISGMYVDEVSNIYSKYKTDDNNEDYKENVQSGNNWQTVEIQYKDKYVYIAIVDKTILEVHSDLVNKDLVRSLIDAMKY